MSDSEQNRRPVTASMGAVTFEQEFEHWIRTRASIYNLDLADAQITILVRHAASIARKYGMGGK